MNEIQLEQVSENVWAHTKRETWCNIAFVKFKDKGLMVDSGLYPINAEIARKTAERVMNVQIKYLIITHHHADHVFGNQVFEDCEIIASSNTIEMMKMQLENYWTEENLEQDKQESPDLIQKWENLKIVLPKTSFNGRYLLEDEDFQIEIIETNGHSSGSSFIFVKPDKVLIAGDLLFSKIFPFAGESTANPFLWIKALEMMIEYHPRKIVPGHGEITDIKELEIHKDYMQKLTKKIEDYILKGIDKEKIADQKDLPIFPYETDKERKKLMYNQFYDVIKKSK